MTAMPVKPTRNKRKQQNSGLFNALTLFALAFTVFLCGIYTLIFINPQIGINPFPPALPTLTPTLQRTFEPTWTPKPVTPTFTASPMPPTFTLEPSNTPYVLGATIEATTPAQTLLPTNTLRPANSTYTASVEYFESTTFKPNSSCGDLIVAGHVLDTQSQHKQGYIIHLGGYIPGKSFNPPIVTLTGSSTDYGPSGFEFILGVPPVASNHTLWVQLFDQQGAPISEQIFLSTFNECKKNLILVGFKQ